MGSTVSLIIFFSLAVFMVIMSVLAVTSKRILRAAVYLLFVLLGTAGLYFLLDYHFLAVVQIAVYAGGIVVLFIFVILLTSNKENNIELHGRKKIFWAIFASVAGMAVVVIVLIKHQFIYSEQLGMIGNQEISMKWIGQALMGTEKYQYLLPFEVLGVLLLACIIGGILIARNR